LSNLLENNIQIINEKRPGTSIEKNQEKNKKRLIEKKKLLLEEIMVFYTYRNLEK